MAEETEKKIEEVEVKRQLDKSPDSKKSAELLAKLTDNARFSENPKETITTLIREMRHPPFGLSRADKIALQRSHGEMIVTVQTEFFKGEASHALNQIAVINDIRKRKLLELWLDYINESGVRINAKLNNFIKDWLVYCKSEKDEAQRVDLDEDDKAILLDSIQKNKERQLNDVNDMLESFWKDKKEEEKKVKDILRNNKI